MNTKQDDGKIILKHDENIAIVQVCRPERKNALTFDMVVKLTETFEQLRDSPDVSAVIVTGTGDSFMSGFDVGKVTSTVGGMSPSEWRKLRDLVAREFEALYKMGKPTIAAVNGSCVVGGMSAALACDIRIVADTARFKVGFRRMALMPSPDICFLLPFLVGLGKAKFMAMVDDFVGADEAYRIGLAEEVVPYDKLMPRAMELARHLASGPMQMFSATKEAMNRAYGLHFEELRRDIDNAQFALTKTQDYQEAINAFLEKRQPNYKGE